MWTLPSGLDLIRKLECLIQPEWHCALGGGVLHKGSSTHDLDVVILPHSSTTALAQWNLDNIYKAMGDLGFYLYRGVEDVHKYWRKRGSVDTKYVEVWLDAGGRRIDLIIWPCSGR